MDPLVAELSLVETAAARERGLRVARAQLALPLRGLAFAWLLLCPVALLIGRNHLAPFVAVSLLGVTFTSWRRYRSSARQLGARGRLWPWIVVALIAQFGGMSASITGTTHHLPWLNAAGPFVINATALLLLAWTVRSRAIALASGLMWLISVITVLIATGDGAVTTQLALYAAVLVVLSGRLTT